MSNIDAFSRLCAQLAKLPGVGRKSAQRMAYYLLSQPEDQVQALADAITTARTKVHECRICGNYTDQDICSMCCTALSLQWRASARTTSASAS